MGSAGSVDNTPGLDVIGDVHGMGDLLEKLLIELGYANEGGAWRHDTRRVAFIGDLVDRGKEHAKVLQIARSMCDAGSALIVMGNHEFNAIAYATRHPTEDRYLRPHTEHNNDTHKEFLELKDDDREAAIEWFKTMPLWLEVDGLRLVHACWDDDAMRRIGNDPTPCGDLDFMVKATTKPTGGAPGNDQYEAIEILLKGPERPVAPNPPFFDGSGKERTQARVRWWDPEATTFETGLIIPDQTKIEKDGKLLEPYQQHSFQPVDPPLKPYTSDVPVLFGHYWEEGTPTTYGPTSACVDYSACAERGQLVAYRWCTGDEALSDDRFVAVG
jgi:hypothetical protein